MGPNLGISRMMTVAGPVQDMLPAQCDPNICAPNTGFPAVTHHQETHKRPKFLNAVSDIVDLERVDHIPTSTNQRYFCYALSNYPSLLAPRFNTEWTLAELIAVRARSSINGLGTLIRTEDLLVPNQTR